MTSLAFSLSRALSREWISGDNIVVTEMDHRANVDTWIIAAEEKGVEVRWLKLDVNSLTLDLTELDNIIDSNTKMVAIGHASNGIGTINDVKKIAKRAHEVGTIAIMDSVHAAPHLFIDRDEMGVDVVLCSAYKFFGPHLGIMSMKQDLFTRIKPYRISTAHEDPPDNFETGTQSFEALAGLIGVVDFIASLGEGSTRREKIKSAYSNLRPYEEKLANKIRRALKEMDHAIVYQANESIPKTPTIAFRLKDLSPAQVAGNLSEKGIFVGDGHFYAKTIGDLLELNETGGWVRIGIAPYNTMEEVDQLLSIIANMS